MSPQQIGVNHFTLKQFPVAKLKLLRSVSSLTELIGDVPLPQSPSKCAGSNISGVSSPSEDTNGQLAPVQAAIFA